MAISITPPSGIPEGTPPHADNLDLLRWNTTTAPLILDNHNGIESYMSEVYQGRYVQTYYMDIESSGGFPPFFGGDKSLYFYFYYTDFRSTGSFPDIPTGSPLRLMLFDYSYEMGSDDPFPLPYSWKNATYMNRLYFRRCGLSTAQVDSLVSEIEALVNAGMSRDASNLYVYLNSTSTGANAALTVATHTANGWSANGTTTKYIQKIINEKLVRIYHNV